MNKYASLRWKVTYLMLAASAFGAGLSAAGFTWFDVKRSREHTRDEMIAIGNIVADQVGPAITLEDGKAAHEILGSLRAYPVFRQAELYDRRGARIANVNPDGLQGMRAMEEGVAWRGNAVMVARPVMAGADRVGTLVMLADIPTIGEILSKYLGGTAMILLLSLVVAFGLAAVLQARISAPILEIAQIAKRIARTHRFADRVGISTGDEVGELAASFNAMLQEIERRDDDLATHRRSLEQQIAERNAVNTELTLAKEKAESAAQQKSEFLANMSHEIRTPMNGVLGMIDLALATPLTPVQADYLNAGKSSAEGLVRIIDDILDVSKMESGKLVIETVDFELRAMLRDALRIFEVPARQKGLDLSLDVDSRCPQWVRGDPVRLRQILVNLVGNAVKFTLQGAIRVSATPSSEGRVLFRVSDTGIGIRADKLGRIFEAFTQADGSHTRRFGGTGLGLTITKRLSGLMGGRVWVESDPGRGSRFSVELPLPERAAQLGAAAPVNVDNAPIVLPPLKVLVAEDNAVNQKVVCSLLRLAGAVATLAGNGAEAYRLFLNEPFDLVLMDVQMPEVDGLEAAGMIRDEEARRSLRRTPILALTAHTAPAQHQQCLAKGMDGVITKPVNRDRLLRSIAEARARFPA